MGIFPELLYQLSGRDQQVTWLDPLLTAPVSSAASNFVFASYTVPADRALLLHHLAARGDPGAGQLITDIHIFLQAPAGSFTVTLERDEVAKAANANAIVTWQGELVIPPNWQVVGAITFDAGVQVNAEQTHVAGILIPIGNIQRV